MRFFAMIRGLVLLSVLTVIPISVNAEGGKWSLPEGMEWRGATKSCKVESEAYPFLKGCYFGRPNIEENTGLVFFRVCDRLIEHHPFLMIDFDREIFVFDYDVNGTNDKELPFSDTHYGPIDPNGIDPASFYNRVNRQLGSCWISPKEST